MLVFAPSAQAAIYWLDSNSNDALAHYRTGEEACVTGELMTRMNTRRAAETNPNVKFRYRSVNVGPDEGIGERVCRGVIERTYASNWVTVELVDTSVYGPQGGADQCAIPNYADPDTGQCGKPKCTSSCCGICANGTNPIYNKSYNGYNIYPNWGDQFKNNRYEYVGINVSIPILNGFQARNQVRQAKITLHNYQLMNTNARYSLQQSVELAFQNMIAAYKQYKFYAVQAKAYEESFRITNIRFTEGVIASDVYILAKGHSDIAETNLAAAKYIYIFRTKVLDYYQGKLVIN